MIYVLAEHKTRTINTIMIILQKKTFLLTLMVLKLASRLRIFSNLVVLKNSNYILKKGVR